MTGLSLTERFALTQNPEFLGRLEIAQLVVAIEVLQEDPATPGHASRLKLAAYVLREPDVVTRRLVLAAAVSPSITADITDDDLLALLRLRWTALAIGLAS